MQNLLHHVYEILKQDERLLSKEGDLLKNKIQELAYKLDEQLIRLLLGNDVTREKFFVSLKDVVVFDQQKFVQFINNKEFLPDSYTAFKNKIGLTDGHGNFISESGDVVLERPYKDGVLAGGQDKEDVKRDEIFYHEVLGSDQIDRLLDPKVFTNFKKYTADGEQSVQDFSRDENGVIKDNLIIKGNNLLALHSLKNQFAGKVKLIYIDPPYNTSTSANTFAYNNTFNHSSWLTFMKNRIEIAKELLTDDGLFVCAIDHYELFYLGALADEIFGRDNRLGVIAAVHNPGGRQDDKFFPTAHENILFYAKDKQFANIYNLGISDDKLKQFKLQDQYGSYKLRGFRRSGNNSDRKDGPGLYYPIYYNPKDNNVTLDKREGYIEILPIDDNGKEKCWRRGKTTFLKKLNEYIQIKKMGDRFDIYVKERESDYIGEKAKTIWINNKYSGQTGTNALKNVFGEKVFTYPKSPYLMRDILKITTKEDDLIIDYHAGSGTTGHAVLELNKEDRGNRQFILVEQMDYIKTVTVPRIDHNIKNNKNGEFIYMEVSQNNLKLIHTIQDTQTSQDLISLYHQLKESSFINYTIDIKTIAENISEFENLSLDDMKRFLIELIDKNALYINYNEMEDESYAISEEDKALNRKFYQ